MAMIAIEGMKFYAHHGYYLNEQKIGNNFGVDVYVKRDISEAAETDQLDKTINYEEIYAIAKKEMEQNAYLIEHVALRIFQAIQQSFPEISYQKVRVTKFNPPIEGEVARTFVEIDSDSIS